MFYSHISPLVSWYITQSLELIHTILYLMYPVACVYAY
jgi:hypothetical protein